MKNTTKHPIFDSFNLKDITLKNKLMVAPMTQTRADKDGVPSENMIDYYSRYAEGGFGAIITEGVYTDHLASQSYPFQPGIINKQQIEGWKQIVNSVKSHGSKIICQLMHGGALSQYHQETIAPSAIQPLGYKLAGYGGEGKFPVPRKMDQADIEKVILGFGESARNAFLAGFDGVEIHAANGYLIDQFLTGYTNTRADRYGGNAENRVRIISEIIRQIRKSVPGAFIIGLRLSEAKVNNLTYRFPGGSKEAIAILREIKRELPDYIHIASEGDAWDKACTYSDGSSYSGLAREIVQVPVVANGGLHNLDLARKILTEQHGDLVSIGKAALKDPYWPHKVLKGTKSASH